MVITHRKDEMHLKILVPFSLSEDMKTNGDKFFKINCDLAKTLTKALNMSKVQNTKLIKGNLPAEINRDS